jgi:hypothetical protein
VIAPDALDKLLTTASAGLDSAKFSEGLHRRAKNAKGQELAAEASEALRLVCCGLEALGATTPTQRAIRAASNPLAELARVESSRPEALALLDALRTAHQLAEALDAKRGDVLAEPIGGSADEGSNLHRGLVWGDRLLQAVCGLELELYGPGEAVTGARE